MAYISRDPFAREEIHRDRVYTGKTCDWCGSVRHSPKGWFLYEYRIETDDGRKDTIRGLFCSVNCMRAYHGN